MIAELISIVTDVLALESADDELGFSWWLAVVTARKGTFGKTLQGLAVVRKLSFVMCSESLQKAAEGLQKVFSRSS